MTAITKISKQDGEYRVRLFIDGVYQTESDYFTDDKQDAHDTAEQMKANAVIKLKPCSRKTALKKTKYRKVTLNSLDCCVVITVLGFIHENKLVWDMSQDSDMNWHEMAKLFVDDLTNHVETHKGKDLKLSIADALVVSDLLKEGVKSEALKEYSQGKMFHWYNLAEMTRQQIDNQIGR